MNIQTNSQIHVGTCGWSYPKDWVDVFYPNFVKSKEYLEYYSKVFTTVEIDSSFYHTPTEQIVQNWVERTPSYFKFSAKLTQEVTHKQKLDINLNNPFFQNHLLNFKPMEQKNKIFGHLIQLPPSFIFDRHWNQLENFLNLWQEWRETKGKEILGSQFSHSSYWPIIEFRHQSWMKERTFALLDAYSTTYCAVIEPILPPRFEITTPELFYLRFHGFGKNPFWNYNFSDAELKTWAKKLLNSVESNKKTKHISYFNNHFSGYAVKNAMDIIPKLNQEILTPIDKLNSNFHRKILEMKNKEKYKHKSLDNWVAK